MMIKNNAYIFKSLIKVSLHKLYSKRGILINHFYKIMFYNDCCFLIFNHIDITTFNINVLVATKTLIESKIKKKNIEFEYL